MVEVTRNNFKEILPDFKHEINKCSFYSIDCEFSSLPADSEFESSFFESGDERYKNIKPFLEGTIVLQVGITPFRYYRDLNNFRAHPYKFYIFPKHFGPLNTSILCKSSTIQFLCDYKFDFGKCFYDGVYYLNYSDVGIIKKELQEDKLLLSIEKSLNLDFLLEIFNIGESIEQWLKTCSLNEVISFPNRPGNPSYGYLLQERIRGQFDEVWTTFNENKSQIVVRRISKEERSNLMEELEKPEVKEQFIEELAGFSEVYKILADSKKPLVGHNLYLDLLAMYNQFYDNLPGTYQKFKLSLNNLFPVIFDTKILSYELNRATKTKEEKGIFENNSLGFLYEHFMIHQNAYKPPKVVLDPGNLYCREENQQSHDAGWDSYMTGYVFLKMATLFAESKTSSSAVSHMTSVELIESIKQFRNMIHLARARVSHLNLEGDDPVSRRPPLLHLASDGRTVFSSVQLNKLLEAYGPVHYKITSPHTAILAVPNYRGFRSILLDFSKDKSFKIEKYHMVRHNKVVKRCLIAGVIIPASIILFLGIRSS